MSASGQKRKWRQSKVRSALPLKADMVRRDGARLRCFTRNGHDWADRFTAIVDAALRIRATFLIDGDPIAIIRTYGGQALIPEHLTQTPALLDGTMIEPIV
jgi:hypothetical protein